MQISDPIPEYEIIAPKEAIINWQHDPLSQQILNIVQAEIIYSGQRIGKGETLGDNIIQATARAVGYTEELEFLEKLFTLREVVESKEDTDDGK